MEKYTGVRRRVLIGELQKMQRASRTDVCLAELPNALLRSELLPSWHLSPYLGLHHQRISLKSQSLFWGGSIGVFGGSVPSSGRSVRKS